MNTVSHQPPQNVAIIGTAAQLPVFKSIIDGLDGVHLTGYACLDGKGVDPLGESGFFEDPVPLIQKEPIQGVVVGGELEERVYWLQKVLTAGKHVLCEQPLGSDYRRAQQTVDLAQRLDRRLGVVSRAFFSPVGRALRQVEGLRKPLFFDLRISLSRDRLSQSRDGVLLCGGMDYLGLLAEFWGPVDSILARSRSLLRNRPTEDVVLAFFRFRDGKEGCLQVNGLGDKDEVELRLFGRQESKTIRSEGGNEKLEEWEVWFHDFSQVLAAGKEPMWDGKKSCKASHLWKWIQQSARLEREVHRGTGSA